MLEQPLDERDVSAMALPQKGDLIAPITALATVSYRGGKDAVVYAGSGGELLTQALQGEGRQELSSTISTTDARICAPTLIFDTHSIHGIRPVCIETAIPSPDEAFLLVFGGKALSICRALNPYRVDACDRESSLVVSARLSLLDDLVLDAFVCSSLPGGKQVLIVGFAHNFLDIYEISFEVEKSGNAKAKTHKSEASSAASLILTKQRRVLGPWRGCLFSLNISPLREMAASSSPSPSKGVVVTTGTVFGRIDLWEVRDLAISTATPLMSLKNHEGVIFRTVWSTDMRTLASVSDDRSVRLWDAAHASASASAEDGVGAPDATATERQLFVGWGHVSRLWDVAYITTPGETVRLASSSEDGSIKIWLWAGPGSPPSASGCIATLRGHLNDVWRVLSFELSLNGFNKTSLLLSGGNDGSIKVWDPESHIFASPETCVPAFSSGLPSCQVPIPAWKSRDAASTLSSPTPAGGSARSNGIGGICCSPCGRYLLVGLAEGRVWLVNTSSSPAWDWTPLWASSERISALHAQFRACKSGPESGYDHVVIACAHPRGLTTLLCVDFATLAFTFERQWKVDDMNTVGVLLLDAPSYCAEADASNAFDVRMLSISVGGRCRLWRLNSNEGKESKDGAPSYTLSQLINCMTGGISEIATSAILLPGHSASGDSRKEEKEELLVVGDVRGSISVFRLPSAAPVEEESVAVEMPCQFLHRVHAGELVSCLAVLNADATASGGATFVSGGHDGTLAYFNFAGHVAAPTGAAGREGSIRTTPAFYCSHTCSALPIRAPTDFFVRRREGLPADLYMSGYVGDSFILHDVRRSVQLMHIEAGSWRRKSACAVISGEIGGRGGLEYTPGAFFVSAIPVGCAGDKTVELKYVHASPCPTLRGADVSHSGSVLYCGVYVGAGGFAAGGEDGRLRVYARHGRGEGRGTRTGQQMSFAGEAVLPSAASIKALASAVSKDSPTEGVLLAGGGRLAYSVWRWRDPLGPVGSPVLSQVSCGYVVPNAVQDHRILCASIVALHSSYLVALCDSRGCASFAVLPCNLSPPLGVLLPPRPPPRTTSTDGAEDAADKEPLPAQKQKQPSSVPLWNTMSTLAFHEVVQPCGGSPVLSCRILAVGSTGVGVDVAGSGMDRVPRWIGVFGASSGEVSVWLLSLPAAPLETALAAQNSSSTLLARYQAHSMGANALDAVLQPCAYFGHGGTDAESREVCYHLMVCSGGDDQAITVAAGSFRVGAGTGVEGISWAQPIRAVRFDGAAGASLEGITLRRDSGESRPFPGGGISAVLCTLSADQRLHEWVLLASVGNAALAEQTEAPFGTAAAAADCPPAEDVFVEKAAAYSVCATGLPFTLRWLGAQVVNVGDPQAMAVGGGAVAIVGQGLQEMHW